MAKTPATQEQVDARTAQVVTDARHQLQAEFGEDWTFVLTYKATPKKKPIVQGRSTTTVPVAQSNGAKALANGTAS